LALRHAHQGADLATTARLAENSYVLRVSPEIYDIVAHPLQSRDQIKLADIAHREFLAQTAQVGIPEDVQPVVDSDQHNILLAHVPVREQGQQAGLSAKSATVDVNHYGPFARLRRSQNIEDQTVFAHRLLGQLNPVWPSAREVFSYQRTRKYVAALLDALRPGHGGVAHSSPRFGFGGGHESSGTFRWARVGNTAKNVDAIRGRPTDFAARGVGNNRARQLRTRSE
jgi:hypothetical protein